MGGAFDLNGWGIYGLNGWGSYGKVSYCFVFLLFVFFLSITTPQVERKLTGMQVVTTSQVQIIGCRSKAIL